jgi:N-(2-amino-2-carboxyethyl)-L-glutamate synthase
MSGGRSLDLGSLSVSQLVRLCAQIGNTPVVTLDVRLNLTHKLSLKLESENPGGSSKDRPALFIVEKLEHRGELVPGDTIVDSTSGNFGVAMAWICRAKGYRYHAVTDPHVTNNNLALMRSLGAHVEIVETRDESGGYFFTRYHRGQEILAAGQAKAWSDQYTNPSNLISHYRTTGPEITAAFPDPPDAVVIPASTGGTLAGVARHLREHAPRCRVVAVDGAGSVVFGGCIGPRVINGLGGSRQSPFITPADYDEVITVSNATAFGCCRSLRRLAIADVGGSSGAVVAAAIRLLARARVPMHIVGICPDHGSSYRSSIYNDEWAGAHGGLSEIDLPIMVAY